MQLLAYRCGKCYSPEKVCKKIKFFQENNITTLRQLVAKNKPMINMQQETAKQRNGGVRLRPITLKIRGFNSFDEEQIIDFQTLTATGLFGIFGPTGSGKSTIIDAITMVIYGEISRYDGGTGKECINANAETMALQLEFSIYGHVYVVERAYKKNGVSILSTMARLYVKTEDGVQILAEKAKSVKEEIEKLIGLNYKDFSRSVVLPQGKFSDFLLLPNSERGNMLERIFKLEKYGDILYRKIKNELNKTKSEIQLMNNSLSHYGEITDELVRTEEEQYRMITKKLEEIKKEQVESARAFERFKKIQELNEELMLYKKQQEDIVLKEDYFHKKRMRLSQARKADNVMSQILSLQDSEKKIHICNESLQKQTLLFSEAEQKAFAYKEKYQKALQIKEEQYPLLIEKESKGKQGIKIMEDADELEAQRKKMQGEYIVKKNEFKALEAEKERQAAQRKELDEKLAQIVERKKEIAIDPVFRQQIGEAYEVWNRYVELAERVDGLKQKQQVMKEEDTKEKIESQASTQRLEALKAQADELREKLENQLKNKPGETDDFIAINQDIVNQENLLKIKIDKKENLAILRKELEELSNALEGMKKEFTATQRKADHQQEVVRNLSDTIEQIKRQNISYRLADTLVEDEPCPVCGSIHHPSPAIQRDSEQVEDILKKEKELKKAEKILQAQKETFQKLSIEIASGEKEIEKLQLKDMSLEEELKGFSHEEESQKLQTAKKSLETLVEKIKEWEEEKYRLEKILSDSISSIHTLSIDIATQNERMASNEKTCLSLQSEIQVMEEKAKGDSEKIKNYAEGLRTEDFAGWNDQFKRFDLEKARLEKEEALLRKDFEIRSKNYEDMTKKIGEVEKDMERISIVGKEKKESIDRMLLQVRNLFDGEKIASYQTYMEDAQTQLKKIAENLEEAHQLYEKYHEQRQSVAELKSGLTTQLGTLREIYESDTNKLVQLLSENCFATKEEAVVAFLKADKQKELELEISAYEELANSIKNNLARLIEKLEGQPVKDIDEQVVKAHEQNAVLMKEIETSTKESVILNERIGAMKENLMKIKELVSQRKKLEHTGSLLSELADLLEGKKFIDFIAQRQLKYITVEASHRLKEMTSGRYALELDGAEFVIRDDHNGGIRRSPRTLSGGETFMVSLCLALALSSKIQLKNSAPLEFFFLDEGFGTLDPMLLDVVMNCLEQLQAEKLSVGIITHVDELKSRINAKLIVTPAEQGLHGTITTISL